MVAPNEFIADRNRVKMIANHSPNDRKFGVFTRVFAEGTLFALGDDDEGPRRKTWNDRPGAAGICNRSAVGPFVPVGFVQVANSSGLFRSMSPCFSARR